MKHCSIASQMNVLYFYIITSFLDFLCLVFYHRIIIVGSPQHYIRSIDGCHCIIIIIISTVVICCTEFQINLLGTSAPSFMWSKINQNKQIKRENIQQWNVLLGLSKHSSIQTHTHVMHGHKNVNPFMHQNICLVSLLLSLKILATKKKRLKFSTSTLNLTSFWLSHIGFWHRPKSC